MSPVYPESPGVYTELIPSGGARAIIPVATSRTAFVGRAYKGPISDPVRIQSFGEYTRKFGGLWTKSTMSYAVNQYFSAGGSDAICVRCAHKDEDTTKNAAKATGSISSSSGTFVFEAANEGEWGNNIRLRVEDINPKHLESDEDDKTLFNLFVKDMHPQLGDLEQYMKLSTDKEHARYFEKVLKERSELIRVASMPDGDPTGEPPEKPNAHSDPTTPENKDPFDDDNADCHTPLTNGADGIDLTDNDIAKPDYKLTKEGLYALEDADIFNLLCIPPLKRGDGGQINISTVDAAIKYCEERKAMYIVDPREAWTKAEHAESEIDTLNIRNKNAAIFFPRVKMADPLFENRLEEFMPCGVIAGTFARIDSQRGIWKAPAGIEANLPGVRALSYLMTDGENGRLNKIGINCLRNFSNVGNIIWGSRTLRGADQLASEYKYIPVMRMALWLELSLIENLRWCVMEPNDEPLYQQIRLTIGSWLHSLYLSGAFYSAEGKNNAYFVKCDKETTTQRDVDSGIVNIIVGFAPLKPAEFIIIKIQQIAGQVQT